MITLDIPSPGFSSSKTMCFNSDEKLVLNLFVLKIFSIFLICRILDHVLYSFILSLSLSIPKVKADFFGDNLQSPSSLPSSQVFILNSYPSSPNCHIILGPGTVKNKEPAAFIRFRELLKSFTS